MQGTKYRGNTGSGKCRTGIIRETRRIDGTVENVHSSPYFGFYAFYVVHFQSTGINELRPIVIYSTHSVTPVQCCVLQMTTMINLSTFTHRRRLLQCYPQYVTGMETKVDMIADSSRDWVRVGLREKRL